MNGGKKYVYLRYLNELPVKVTWIQFNIRVLNTNKETTEHHINARRTSFMTDIIITKRELHGVKRT